MNEKDNWQQYSSHVFVKQQVIVIQGLHTNTFPHFFRNLVTLVDRDREFHYKMNEKIICYNSLVLLYLKFRIKINIKM